jgi:hypothetical protein
VGWKQRGSSTTKQAEERAWAGIGSNWSTEWGADSLAQLVAWEQGYLSEAQRQAAKEALGKTYDHIVIGQGEETADDV